MIFINQSAGELFSDVIESLSESSGSHLLITGNVVRTWDNIKLLKAVHLQKSNHIKRMLTWGLFFLQTFFYLLLYAREEHLFFVTNPPMTMWMAPFFKYYKKSKYSLLIYDSYPESLFVAGILSEKSAISKIWNRLNSSAFCEAENIITLGKGMSETLQNQMIFKKKKHVAIIENWVDTNYIKPIQKSKNPVIHELKLAGKFIVLYAGSFGATHGVPKIIDCAELLINNRNIHFVLVGKGTEEQKIQEIVKEKKLTNLSILPFQTKEKFRYVAAMADINIILLKRGGGKAIMPSKIYTALSAGTAIVAMADADSDLAKLIEKHKVGMIIPPGNTEVMAQTILKLTTHTQFLDEFKFNSRHAAVNYYDKKKQCNKYKTIFKRCHVSV